MAPASAGYLLRVDLTTGSCQRELLAASLLQDCLGGRGLGTALLQEYAGLDPLSPEMPLVLTIGPLCGTPVPMSSRCVLTGRSPLTNTIFSSTSGGPLGPCLLGAGLTAVLVQGTAASPCLLEIGPTGERLIPADQLWGLGCGAALQQLGQFGAAAVIGPAGEQQVRYASVETASGEPFSRGGLGAVMGSKRLKGIVLKTGPATAAIADQAGLGKALEDLMRLFRASPFLLGPLGIREYGTSALVDLLKQRGMLPGRHFASFTGDETRWNAHALRQRFHPQPGGCYDCTVACKRIVSDGTLLPEYDQLAAFGGLCGLDDLEQIIELCSWCRDQGVDPVSYASEKTAGAGETAMTVKGLDLPPYDPRASTGLALAYATSPHGGSHLPAWPIASEILRKPVPTDRFSFDGKARVIAMFEDANAAVDCLSLCRFASAAVELEELAALLSAVIGQGYSPADLIRIGRRTVQKERLFNQQCGFTAADDSLPQQFFTESANGLKPLDQQRFEQELAAYHRIRAAQCL
ncbi:aldehyde ferredoxin oxidoreductase C-terminal domain-containing protein [Trichlorobacter lovleyi]|uniref:Aldehyde ferredoxin oxidoreductase n=1 Tax=Trichlorobacter lovleyi (strain ATCC BAA-1151 / DSM 17278 / SZ) TaxID=398767 RepID=B3E4L1_TRIL1|nr:aldehyde ferredoxin oxidoreductase C-terminal domain-containing protein [Trichlorobacter lovleyi]ACD95947.1 Aldehyde ferredoxin oxidoreductase [Trichlorobacter lovleyi SZ]